MNDDELSPSLMALARELEEAGAAVMPAVSAPPPVELGGDFRILRPIGAGANGQVYEALQLSLNRRVAVKLLAAESPEARAAFARESRLVARLHHPNIVQVIRAGIEDDRPYYVMELIACAGCAAREKLPPSTAARIVRDAARALAYAHGCGVVHRDIKPANLLVGADGVTRVGDFGMAGGGAEPTGGTLRYLPPERLRGENEGDAAGDVYALALTLGELVSGAPLVVGTSVRDVKRAILEGRLTLPALGDKDFEAIMAKGCARDPAARYADMAAFAADLERYLAGELVAARPAGLLRRAEHAARRHPGHAALAAAAFAAVLLAGGAVAFGLARADAARRSADKAARSEAELAAKTQRQIENFIAAVNRMEQRMATETHWDRSDFRDIDRLRRQADRMLMEYPDDPRVADAVHRFRAACRAHQASRRGQ